MIEKGKISGLQMALLIHANIVATAILIVPGITFKDAGRDILQIAVFNLISI